jgi:hypothetical protein
MDSKQFLSLIAVLVALALTGLLLLCAGSTSAQVEPCSPVVTDPDRLIWDGIGVNPGDDMYPDVAYNSQDDEYLVVFEWPDASGSGRDIASIRVDANGQAALSPNGVAINSAYTDTHPAVAYNPTNNTYFVAWERSPGSDGNKDIVRVVLNASGAVSGTEYIVVDWNGDQRFPDVAYSAVDDRYLVVWEDHYPYLTDGPDIYGASFDGLGSDRKYLNVTEPTDGQQTLPAVTANDANGQWLVTWRDSRNSSTTGYDIYGQQVEFAGSSLLLWGSQIAVGTIPGSAGAPDVAWGQVGSGEGEFLTAWPEPYEVMLGQRILANSALTGDVITVSNYTSSKSVPAVAFDATDKAWWVVWEDNRDYG